MLFNRYDLQGIIGAKADIAMCHIQSRMPSKTVNMEIPVNYKGKTYTRLVGVAHFDVEYVIKEARETVSKNRNKRVNIRMWTMIVDALESMRAYR